MIEEHLLHTRVESNTLELAEARGVRGFDHHQSPDRLELETARLDDRAELVDVEAVEVADVRFSAPTATTAAG
jgi:hypothetical protein